jgi:hypothetical protein
VRARDEHVEPLGGRDGSGRRHPLLQPGSGPAARRACAHARLRRRDPRHGLGLRREPAQAARAGSGRRRSWSTGCSRA